jgi:hypothetical protein
VLDVVTDFVEVGLALVPVLVAEVLKRVRMSDPIGAVFGVEREELLEDPVHDAA